MHYDLSPGSASKIIKTLAVKPGRVRLSSIDALIEVFNTARLDLEQVWQKWKSSLKDRWEREER
jgi:hypothetical protein